MIGVGMGIGFPALNVGAMGAVTGPDLGLASGVLNTARQLGAALGVAILIATFGGALHAHMSWFADRTRSTTSCDDWRDAEGRWPAVVIQSTLHDYTGGTQDRFEPEPGFDEEIIRQTAGSAREGFAWAFRQAALLVLTALPLMGALRRTPAQARAEAMAAAGAARARRLARTTASSRRRVPMGTARLPRRRRRPAPTPSTLTHVVHMHRMTGAALSAAVLGARGRLALRASRSAAAPRTPQAAPPTPPATRTRSRA